MKTGNTDSLSRQTIWRILFVGIVLLGFFTALIDRLFAHGGEDHGPAAPAQATAVETAATASEGIFVTKEQQFGLEMLTEPAAIRELRGRVELTGRVIPRTEAVAEVVAPVPGRVVGTGIPRLGEYVRRGQVLFRVEQVLAPSERASLRTEQIRTKAELDAAERETSRFEHLEGVVAGKQLTEARIRRDAARETYNAISAQLARRNATVAVTAPISGEIVRAEIASGEILDGTEAVYEIADLSKVWIEANLFEKDIERIAGASSAEIRTSSYPDPDDVFAGTLYRTGSTVDPESRTITALFLVENSASKLKLNMSASIAVATSIKSGVLAVPRSAIVQGGTRSVVFVHTAPEQFAVRNVVLGSASEGDYVEITSGVNPGDRVLISGTHQLKGAAGL